MADFLNPYHFVPLQEKKAKANVDDELKFTGKMRVKITSKTPLFIPNTSSEKAFYLKGAPEEHKSYDFFSYTQVEDAKKGEAERKPSEPVIPGSEIRGVIRNIYETLTASCMSAIDDPDIMQRTSFSFSPALIKRIIKNNDIKYELIPCETASLKGNLDRYGYQLGEGDMIIGDPKKNRNYAMLPDDQWFTPKEYDALLDKDKYPEDKEGYILIGEPGPMNNPRKANAKFFYLDKKRKSIGSINMDILDAVLLSYEKEKNTCINTGRINGRHLTFDGYSKYAKALKTFKSGNGNEYFPVYFWKPFNDQEILYLSPACITKKAMNSRLKDILNQFAPCSEKDKLCPACYLFGTVSSRGKSPFVKASRIRFADSYLSKEDREKDTNELFTPLQTLPELSSPKLSATEFYLKKPNGAVFWTYDYWTDKNNKVHPYDENTKLEIAGRKYYWHHKDAGLYFSDETTKYTANNKTIRPLKAGITFLEDIYFDNISLHELQQLYYICNISENPNQGYKLGAAKPFGYGSISITVENVKYRAVGIENNLAVYKEIDFERDFLQDSFESIFPACGDEVRKAFDTIISFDAANGMKIIYPINDLNNPYQEGFKWFVDNRKNSMGQKETIQIKSYMPSLSDQINIEVNPDQNEVIVRAEERRRQKIITGAGR